MRRESTSVGGHAGSATCPYCAIISSMPRPFNERQSLEQELAELPVQIAVYLRELTETPEASVHRVRRQRLAWQIRNLENRLAEVRARLAGIRAETR